MKAIFYVLVAMAPVAHGLDANGRDCSKPSLEPCYDVAPPVAPAPPSAPGLPVPAGAPPLVPETNSNGAWLDQALPWQARFGACIRAGRSATYCQALIGPP